MIIFTLGPLGSYSYQVALKLFPTSEIKLTSTISEVFEQVEKNKKYFGIVPLENLIEGSVRETLDNLYESNLKIYDIVTLNIHHCLAAKNKNFKTIISHPQGIAQCRNNLKKHYKNLNQEITSSTAKAALTASENNNFAAITSSFCADIYDLKIINNNFSDTNNNQTKFAIISTEANPKTAISTLATLTPKNQDEPGLLIKMLFPFQENKVNLTKIESRPNKQNFNEFIFFIEFEGDAKQARARKILTYLEKDLEICKIKILGGQIGQTVLN